MKEQNSGEYDALVDEVEKLRAEIAKLRAEREELIKLADLWDQQCGRESFAPNFADELRAALAKVKGE